MSLSTSRRIDILTKLAMGMGPTAPPSTAMGKGFKAGPAPKIPTRNAPKQAPARTGTGTPGNRVPGPAGGKNFNFVQK